MKKWAASFAIVLCLSVTFSIGVGPAFAAEIGPTPQPPESHWMYIWEDIDGDNLLERIYFLTRDEYMFGSVFENIPPTIPYNDTPGSFGGDNVGIRSPDYQVISETGENQHVLLHYQISDVSNPAMFISDAGGLLTTTWEENDVRLTRKAELNKDRLLLTFAIENVGSERLVDLSFVERHRFDDGQFIFDGDEYKGGQLIGRDHPGWHDRPLMGMVYAPIPDSLIVDDSLAFDPSTATFLLGDLDPGERSEIQLAVVWSTLDDPNDAFDQLIEKMLGQKVELRTIEARIEIHPETLNLKSNGKWVTCIIELPDYLDESDIDPSTVLLEGIITAQKPVLTGHSLNVKFDRSELEDLLTSGKGIVLTVSGRLWNGMAFQGTDSIDAIHD